MGDGCWLVGRTLGSVVENDYPMPDAALTPRRSNLGRMWEKSSDNQDHIHYYHNRDTVPSLSLGWRISMIDQHHRYHPYEVRHHRI